MPRVLCGLAIGHAASMQHIHTHNPAKVALSGSVLRQPCLRGNFGVHEYRTISKDKAKLRKERMANSSMQGPRVGCSRSHLGLEAALACIDRAPPPRAPPRPQSLVTDPRLQPFRALVTLKAPIFFGACLLSCASVQQSRHGKAPSDKPRGLSFLRPQPKPRIEGPIGIRPQQPYCSQLLQPLPLFSSAILQSLAPVDQSAQTRSPLPKTSNPG